MLTLAFLAAASALYVVIHLHDPVDKPPESIKVKSYIAVVLGAAAGVGLSFVMRGAMASDPMPAYALLTALAAGYVVSGIVSFLDAGRKA